MGPLVPRRRYAKRLGSVGKRRGTSGLLDGLASAAHFTSTANGMGMASWAATGSCLSPIGVTLIWPPSESTVDRSWVLANRAKRPNQGGAVRGGSSAAAGRIPASARTKETHQSDNEGGLFLRIKHRKRAISASQMTSQIGHQPIHRFLIKPPHQRNDQREHLQVVVEIDDGIVRVNIARRNPQHDTGHAVIRQME